MSSPGIWGLSEDRRDGTEARDHPAWLQRTARALQILGFQERSRGQGLAGLAVPALDYVAPGHASRTASTTGPEAPSTVMIAFPAAPRRGSGTALLSHLRRGKRA